MGVEEHPIKCLLEQRKLAHLGKEIFLRVVSLFMLELEIVAQLSIMQCKLLFNYRSIFYSNFYKNIYVNRRVENFSVTVLVLVKYKG